MLHHHAWVAAYFCTGVSDDEHHVCVTRCLPQQTRAADHTLASSAVAVNMCVPAPGISREMGGRSLITHTLSPTTQDGCFPSSSSISHPMIHFTDTWVIIEVCSSPLGTEPQHGGGGVCLPGNAKTGQPVRECKTKRQEWRWRREWNKLNLTAVIGLV